MKSASGLQYMKRLWRQRFWRYLFTIPLYDLLIYMLCMGWLPDCLNGLIVPLMIGGLMLLGIIGGAVWAGLPGLRWYTAAIYTLLSVLIFPLTWLFLDAGMIDVFLLSFFMLSCQQGMGFALGAWCRISIAREKM